MNNLSQQTIDKIQVLTLICDLELPMKDDSFYYNHYFGGVDFCFKYKDNLLVLRINESELKGVYKNHSWISDNFRIKLYDYVLQMKNSNLYSEERAKILVEELYDLAIMKKVLQ